MFLRLKLLIISLSTWCLGYCDAGIDKLAAHCLKSNVGIGMEIEELLRLRPQAALIKDDPLGPLVVEIIERNTFVSYILKSEKVNTIRITKRFIDPLQCVKESQEIKPLLETFRLKETKVATTLNMQTKGEEFPLECWVSPSSESIEVWYGKSTNDIHVIILDPLVHHIGDLINIEITKESIDTSIENMRQRRTTAQKRRDSLFQQHPGDRISDFEGKLPTNGEIVAGPEADPIIEQPAATRMSKPNNVSGTPTWILVAGSVAGLCGFSLILFFRKRQH